MNERTRHALMKAADGVMASIPRRVPSKAALENCKIISHRGECDNVRVFENTLPAFDIARKAGVWGIECDIRWTRDLVPVICHDSDALRVFKNPVRVADLSFAELRERVPQIPSLEELIGEYGGNTHLMLELKTEPFPDLPLQKARLKELLSPLEAGNDYHLLSLEPDLFELFDIVEPRHCYLVAEENVSDLSQRALVKGYGGLGGHFLLLNNRVKNLHDQVGQRLGTGFVASRNCLFRELNRGVEWIFSNHAMKIQQIRDRYLARS